MHRINLTQQNATGGVNDIHKAWLKSRITYTHSRLEKLAGHPSSCLSLRRKRQTPVAVLSSLIPREYFSGYSAFFTEYIVCFQWHRGGTSTTERAEDVNVNVNEMKAKTVGIVGLI